jgi:hypothetical protein
MFVLTNGQKTHIEIQIVGEELATVNISAISP